MCIALLIAALPSNGSPSEDLGGQGDDLHEVSLAQLAGHRPEDPGTAGIVLRVDQHRGVLVEGDVGAIWAAELLAGADDDRLHDLALADAALRARLLDGGGDHVADSRIAPVRPPLHANAEDLARAGVVGHPEPALLLDHRVLLRLLQDLDQPP